MGVREDEHHDDRLRLTASPRTASKSGKHTDLSKLTGLKTLITTFAGHIAAEAARKE